MRRSLRMTSAENANPPWSPARPRSMHAARGLVGVRERAARHVSPAAAWQAQECESESLLEQHALCLDFRKLVTAPELDLRESEPLV